MYASGLDGPEAAWANCWYHGHCTLPADMMLAAKNWAQEAHDKAGIASQTVIQLYIHIPTLSLGLWDSHNAHLGKNMGTGNTVCFWLGVC